MITPCCFSLVRRVAIAAVFGGAVAALPGANAPEERPLKWHPGHYIFVNSAEISDELIALPHFRGIQRIYSWAKLEPEYDRYDFSAIRSDLERLKPHGKQLVLQVQYKAFGKDSRLVPAYLTGPEYGGGVYRANSGSWNPVIWNARVGERMAALFNALGREFDRHPGVEAVVLPETAPSARLVESPQPGVEEYTLPRYVQSLKDHMLALRRAFPNTAVIQYTNFPPPALPELTAYEKEIGVGMGGPDVYPRESDLLDPEKGAYRYYADLAGVVPLGAAVQSPDYSVANWKRTAAFNKSRGRESVAVTPEEEKPIPVREHLQLARGKLRLNYLFWAAQPKEFFAHVGKMLAEPDLASDPAGGLVAARPTKLRLDEPAAPSSQPAPEETPLVIPGSEPRLFRTANGIELRLHVVKPQGWTVAAKQPALVAFFGGGWNGGSPARSITWARWAAERGAVGIAPDYRTRNRHSATPEEAISDAREPLNHRNTEDTEPKPNNLLDLCALCSTIPANRVFSARFSYAAKPHRGNAEGRKGFFRDSALPRFCDGCWGLGCGAAALGLCGSSKLESVNVGHHGTCAAVAPGLRMTGFERWVDDRAGKLALFHHPSA